MLEPQIELLESDVVETDLIESIEFQESEINQIDDLIVQVENLMTLKVSGWLTSRFSIGF